jgi:hypothetical protein
MDASPLGAMLGVVEGSRGGIPRWLCLASLDHGVRSGVGTEAERRHTPDRAPPTAGAQLGPATTHKEGRNGPQVPRLPRDAQ